MSLVSETTDARPLRSDLALAEPSMAGAGDYFQLMKPRVMSLVVFTALVGMIVAPVHVNPVIGFFALVCIAVGAGAAGALNMWYDADIDQLMKRTSTRPIPAGRVLPREEFRDWFSGAFPEIARGEPENLLAPATVTDRTDPQLVHLDGLNLSRAWMLKGIGLALPARDARRAPLLALSAEHAAAALPAVTGAHYEGGHWLGTFAVYLTSH